MNNWRYLHYHPGVAHLWKPLVGGIWRSRCAMMHVIDLVKTTDSLSVESDRILKCKQCIKFEVHKKEAA